MVGYIGYYQVSDLGRVRSVDRVVPNGLGGMKRLKGRVLRVAPSGSCGHFGVDLCREGIATCKHVHRLVMAAWIGPCPDGEQVRHGPKGKLDNSVANLCYGTSSEDGFDKRRDGTHGGKAVRRSDGVEFISMRVAAEESNCDNSHIWKVCNGRLNTTGGFGWSYV